jgi:hypothetical protein
VINVQVKVNVFLFLNSLGFNSTKTKRSKTETMKETCKLRNTYVFFFFSKSITKLIEMEKIIMIVLLALATVLYFSPETVLADPQNDILKNIKENSQLVALGCVAGAGYLYYTTMQEPAAAAVTASTVTSSDLPTYEQSTSMSTSMSSQQ